MSNLWFNIRFGTKHLQVSPWKITFKENPHQVYFKNNDPNWKWFEVYCLFGKEYG
jgi:hypothetical protein